MVGSNKLVLDCFKAASHLRSEILPREVAKVATAMLSSESSNVAALPDLPYDYDALEPIISAETMTLHHTKHHNTYVTNLNVSLEKLDKAVTEGDASGIISLEGALKFNGGGHLNHSLFWDNLCPTSSSQAELKDGPLKKKIDECFGDVEKMKNKMAATTIAIQGSGWGWLGFDPESGRIVSATRANQDPLEATAGLLPLLGIDVWEHAYYVDYRNVRPDYVNAMWDVINWEVVEQRFIEAQKKAD